MEEPARRGTAVVCEDRPWLSGAVAAVVARSGWQVSASTASFADLAPLLQGADLAVVSLPLAGLGGLRAVGELCAAAPHCDVVLLSCSPALAPTAQQVGARALVPDDDLRALAAVLRQLSRDRSGRTRTKPSA